VPRQPQWYLRVPEALATLSAFPAPVVDRQALEQLLGIGRRDAIRLMHRLGGYQCGRTFLVERDRLRQALETVARGERWQWEARRRLRLGHQLLQSQQEWKARHVQIPAPPSRFPGTIDGLPASVSLSPGRLQVEFDGAVDLLAQLVALTQAIGNDYDRFEELLGS
jgi:hypothetical protein